MKKSRWLKWLGIVLLAAGCTGLLAACGDDDDDGDAAGGGAGDTIIIEGDDDDAPATPVVDDIADGDAETDGAAAALTAPQLVAPRNGQVFDPPDGNYVNIRFEWTAIPGAADYVIELADYGRKIVAGTSTERRCASGTLYRWRVCARDANGANGPISGFFSFRTTGLQQ